MAATGAAQLRPKPGLFLWGHFDDNLGGHGRFSSAVRLMGVVPVSLNETPAALNPLLLCPISLWPDLAGPYLTNDIGQRGVSNRGNPGVNWDASLTWIKGNHNIKTGAQFIYVNRLQSNLSQSFSFSDAQTSNLGAARTGNSLASALLAVPSGYSAQAPQYGEVFLRFNVW